MAPDLERRTDAPDGHGRLPQKGLVDLHRGTYLESRDLFPGGAAAERVSCLRREYPSGAAGRLPEDAGGDGIRLGWSANSQPKQYSNRRNEK